MTVPADSGRALAPSRALRAAASSSFLLWTAALPKSTAFLPPPAALCPPPALHSHASRLRHALLKRSAVSSRAGPHACAQPPTTAPPSPPSPPPPSPPTPPPPPPPRARGAGRWAGAELRAYARAVALTAAIAAALCFVDVLLALAVLWAGTGQATAELFGFGVGGRSAMRALRVGVRSLRVAARETWHGLRRETRERFLDD